MQQATTDVINATLVIDQKALELQILTNSNKLFSCENKIASMGTFEIVASVLIRNNKIAISRVATSQPASQATQDNILKDKKWGKFLTQKMYENGIQGQGFESRRVRNQSCGKNFLHKKVKLCFLVERDSRRKKLKVSTLPSPWPAFSRKKLSLHRDFWSVRERERERVRGALSASSERARERVAISKLV